MSTEVRTEQRRLLESQTASDGKSLLWLFLQVQKYLPLPLYAKYNYIAQWCFTSGFEGQIYDGACGYRYVYRRGIHTAKPAVDR